MADLYRNFEELASANIYGSDYHILLASRGTNIAFMTPHGGGLETGCTELTIFSAGTEYSYYCFETWRATNNGDLHVTSANFDEPNGRRLVASSLYTISYHGYSDTVVKNTKIGGLDYGLRNLVQAKLTAAGFLCEQEPPDSVIAGVDPENIVNANGRAMGVQLELSTAQRNAFFGTNTRAGRRNTINQEFNSYVAAIVDAVTDYTT